MTAAELLTLSINRHPSRTSTVNKCDERKEMRAAEPPARTYAPMIRQVHSHDKHRAQLGTRDVYAVQACKAEIPRISAWV